jgi:hypothetical protein
MAILSDEVLCAYVDGALSPDERANVERLIGAHPELQQRVAAFRRGDEALRALGGPSLSQTGADPLADRIRAELPPKAYSFAGMRKFAPLLSTAVVAGVLGLAAGRMAPGQPDPFAPDPALARALDSAPSGELRDGVRIILTFETAASAPCRQYTSYRPGRSGEGLACRAEGRWRVQAWLAGDTGSAEGFHAAGADTSLDALIDGMDATGALSAEKEADYIRRRWRQD